MFDVDFLRKNILWEVLFFIFFCKVCSYKVKKKRKKNVYGSTSKIILLGECTVENEFGED